MVARCSVTPTKSPFVRMATASKVRIDLDRKVPYELDGSTRPKTVQIKAQVVPKAIEICVP